MRKTVGTPISISLINDGKSAQYYNDELYAWSNVERTTDTTTSPFGNDTEPNSAWKSYIPENTNGYAYLWCKVIHHEWVESTRSYTNETPQYYRKTGTNGTSIKVSGSVDYFTNEYPPSADHVGEAAITSVSNKHIFACQQVAASTYAWVEVAAASDGDAYIVQKDNYSGSSYKGHLVMWSDEASSWIDLGIFQGQAGKTYYTHIAWADAVTLSDSELPIPPGQTSRPNATWVGNGSIIPTDPPKAWMGYLINETVLDSTAYTKYTWSKVKGEDACSVLIDKTAFFVNNNLAGYVANGESIGTFNISYMVGGQKKFPWLYMENGTTRINSAVLLERNLDIQATSNYTSNQAEFRLFTASDYSGEKLQLNGGQKSYTFIVRGATSSSAQSYNSEWPDMKITITLQGNNPSQRQTTTGYLALSSANSNESDPSYGRPPSAIPMHCWSATPPLATQSQPYIWKRQEIIYSNGETETLLELYSYRGTAVFSASLKELSVESNPSNRLLQKDTNDQICCQFFVNNVQTKIDIICIKNEYHLLESTDNNFGIDFYIVGGRNASNQVIDISNSPIKLSFAYTHYTNDGVDYGAAYYLRENYDFYGLTIEARVKAGYPLYEYRGTKINRLLYAFTAVSEGASAASNMQSTVELNVSSVAVNKYDPIDVTSIFAGTGSSLPITLPKGTEHGMGAEKSKLYATFDGVKYPVTALETPSGQSVTPPASGGIAAANCQWETNMLLTLDRIFPNKALSYQPYNYRWVKMVRPVTVSATETVFDNQAPHIGDCYETANDALANANSLIQTGNSNLH